MANKQPKKPPYEERLLIPLVGNENFKFQTKYGSYLAIGYNRIVIGGRGPYIEFETDHLIKDHIYMPDDQLWRREKKYHDRIFYYEYRSKDEAYVKLYYQLRTVDYADYLVHKWYISPFDLFTEEGQKVIE